MRYTERYIPPNIGTGTLFGGRVKMRNLVETIIYVLLIYLITKPLAIFLPAMVVAGIRFTLWAVVSMLSMMGINGEPLSIFFLNIVNYSNTRNYVSLKPPQKETALTEKKKKKSFSDKLTDMMFTGKKKEE